MRVLPLVLTLCVLAGCEKTQVVPQKDAGPACEIGQTLVRGVCLSVCTRDGDCPAGQRCDLLTGECAPKPAPIDAGETLIPCTEGAVRCSVDGTAVQTCNDEGVFATTQQCAQPDGYCQNERCLTCRPGARRCAAGNGATEICLDDGSGYRTVTCAAGATCVAGECAECTIGQRRCSTDGTTLEECKRLPREDLSAGYQPAGDNFDGTCVTQVCEQGSMGAQCRAPACVPGAQRCANASTQEVCSNTGAWSSVTCNTLPGFGATAECLNGTCIDECADAVRARSYFGCEYWSAVLDNGTDRRFFKGNTTSGQGTTDSDFTFVVTNQSVLPAVVEVWRFRNGAPERVKQVTVPGRTDPTTRGLVRIPVPWQSITPDGIASGEAYTGRARYAYRVTSTRPITLYQFNPVDAVKTTTRTCSSAVGSSDCTCNEYADFNSTACFLYGSTAGICGTGGRCTYPSYSNDASLVLPTHILGNSYVGLTMEHIVNRTRNNGAPTSWFGGSLVVVAPQDNTTVTIRVNARTKASTTGTAIPLMAVGETRTFTLASYEVLQLSSAMPIDVVNGSTVGNLECGSNPYNGEVLCRVANGDLTGSIITADKPIAVFGGSDCTLRNYNETACDHVEEQLFPFVTWGKNFVATRTAPLRLSNNQFASAANAGPDYYKIVAGCPETAANTPCPNGTTITLSTAPAAGDVLVNAGGCMAGTSLTTNNCRLRGGGFIEFRSKVSFTITADQPVQVAQIFAGQNATTGSVRPVQGDPSLVLLPPVEQWRARYTVLTAPGTRDNYLGMVIDGSRVSLVRVDGVTVTGWANVTGSTFRTVNWPVTTGSHSIEVVPLPDQQLVPGAGVTVYGFDSFVSYGYTGGLDLTTIVTGVTPGG
jgi:hypothetical protein